jgi:hypothetical protein
MDSFFFSTAKRLESEGFWRKTLSSDDYTLLSNALVSSSAWTKFFVSPTSISTLLVDASMPRAEKRMRASDGGGASSTTPKRGSGVKSSAARFGGSENSFVANDEQQQQQQQFDSPPLSTDAQSVARFRVRALLFDELLCRSAGRVGGARFDDMYYTLDEMLPVDGEDESTSLGIGDGLLPPSSSTTAVADATATANAVTTIAADSIRNPQQPAMAVSTVDRLLPLPEKTLAALWRSTVRVPRLPQPATTTTASSGTSKRHSKSSDLHSNAASSTTTTMTTTTTTSATPAVKQEQSSSAAAPTSNDDNNNTNGSAAMAVDAPLNGTSATATTTTSSTTTQVKSETNATDAQSTSVESASLPSSSMHPADDATSTTTTSAGTTEPLGVDTASDALIARMVAADDGIEVNK